MNIDIEKMNIQDLENIKTTLESDFDEFWNYNTLKEELESENSYLIVAKSNNNILGFAGIKIILDETNIMNIVVKKDSRNHGIGSLLLKSLIDYSKQQNLNSITLEVNENNLSAINLYNKFEFKEIGIRKKYYNGKDNALIMTKKI